MHRSTAPNRRRRLIVGLAGIAAAVAVTSTVVGAESAPEPPAPPSSGNISIGDSFDPTELVDGVPVGDIIGISDEDVHSSQALAPASTTTRFVPVTPCRAVDTRFATGGKIAANTNRSFNMTTTNMGTQGGSNTGCGVPGWATAVGVNYAVVNPEGAGFGKAWPSNIGEPATSVINFLSTGTAATANSGVLSISPSGGVTTKFSRPVNLIVDITGFYIRDLYGTVTSSGGVEPGSSLVDSVDHTGVGTYEVDFGAWVDGCVPQVTPLDDQYAVYANLVTDPGENDRVFVDVESTDGSIGTPGSNVDAPFNIAVHC